MWLFRAEKIYSTYPHSQRQTHKRCTRKVFFIVTFEKQHTIFRLESFANDFFFLPFFRKYSNIQDSFLRTTFSCLRIKQNIGWNRNWNFSVVCLFTLEHSFVFYAEKRQRRSGRQAECFIELKIIKCCFVVSWNHFPMELVIKI